MKDMPSVIASGGFEGFTEKGRFEEIYVSYDSEALRYFFDQSKALIEELDIINNSSILDVGTGTGHTAIEIASQNPTCSIMGIDSSPNMLNIAEKKKKQLKNINFKLHDWESLQSLNCQYDIITSSTGISFVKNLNKFIDSVSSALKPNGKFAFVNIDDETFARQTFDPFSSLYVNDLISMEIFIPKKFTLTEVNNHFIELLKEKGFMVEKVINKQFEYNLNSTEDWWEIIYRTAMRDFIDDSADRAKLDIFKERHLKNIEKQIESGNNKYVVNAKIVICKLLSN